MIIRTMNNILFEMFLISINQMLLCCVYYYWKKGVNVFEWFDTLQQFFFHDWFTFFLLLRDKILIVFICVCYFLLFSGLNNLANFLDWNEQVLSLYISIVVSWKFETLNNDDRESESESERSESERERNYTNTLFMWKWILSVL
jgi:hypothetical protein